MLRIFLALWLALTPAFAWAGSMTLMGAGKPAAAAASFTTWDPTTHKSANLNLTNNNLTATDGASAYNGVLALASHSTGKYYFEVHADTLSSNFLIGIGNASATLTNFAGASTNSIAVNFDGNVYYNSGNPTGSPVASFAVGNTISVAVDLTNALIWFRTNAGNWNNVAGGDPTNSSTGHGIALSVASGPYFPITTMITINDAGTANFGASAYAQSVPSGYSNW
jgi:hypothetical protein